MHASEPWWGWVQCGSSSCAGSLFLFASQKVTYLLCHAINPDAAACLLLCCPQGHPEFDGEVVDLLAQPKLDKIGAADVALMEESMAKLPVVNQHAEQLRGLCRAFLKGA